jgi:hypothetical protein
LRSDLVESRDQLARVLRSRQFAREHFFHFQSAAWSGRYGGTSKTRRRDPG